MTSPPAPPDHIDGTVTAGPEDTAHLARMIEAGFVRAAAATQNPTLTRAACGLAAAAFWPLLPAAVTLQHALVLRPGTRYYLSVDREAVLAVGVRRDAWFVHAHVAARPGSGQGRALRALVGPALATAADASGTRIEAVAINRAMAERYAAEFPGLVDVGPGFPQGRRLRREPRTP